MPNLFILPPHTFYAVAVCAQVVEVRVFQTLEIGGLTEFTLTSKYQTALQNAYMSTFPDLGEANIIFGEAAVSSGRRLRRNDNRRNLEGNDFAIPVTIQIAPRFTNSVTAGLTEALFVTSIVKELKNACESAIAVQKTEATGMEVLVSIKAETSQSALDLISYDGDFASDLKEFGIANDIFGVSSSVTADTSLATIVTIAPSLAPTQAPTAGATAMAVPTIAPTSALSLLPSPPVSGNTMVVAAGSGAALSMIFFGVALFRHQKAKARKKAKKQAAGKINPLSESPLPPEDEPALLLEPTSNAPVKQKTRKMVNLMDSVRSHCEEAGPARWEYESDEVYYKAKLKFEHGSSPNSSTNAPLKAVSSPNVLSGPSLINLPPESPVPLKLNPLSGPPLNAPPLNGPALNGPLLNDLSPNAPPLNGPPLNSSPLSDTPPNALPLGEKKKSRIIRGRGEKDAPINGTTLSGPSLHALRPSLQKQDSRKSPGKSKAMQVALDEDWSDDDAPLETNSPKLKAEKTTVKSSQEDPPKEMNDSGFWNKIDAPAVNDPATNGTTQNVDDVTMAVTETHKEKIAEERMLNVAVESEDLNAKSENGPKSDTTAETAQEGPSNSARLCFTSERKKSRIVRGRGEKDATKRSPKQSLKKSPRKQSKLGIAAKKARQNEVSWDILTQSSFDGDVLPPTAETTHILGVLDDAATSSESESASLQGDIEEASGKSPRKKIRKKHRKHKLKMTTKVFKKRGSRVQPGAGDGGSYAVVDPSSHAVASSANDFAVAVNADPISSTNTKDFLGLLDGMDEATSELERRDGGSQDGTEKTDGEKKIADHDKEKVDSKNEVLNTGEKMANLEKTAPIEEPDLLSLLDDAATSSESESDGAGSSDINAGNRNAASLLSNVEEVTGKSPRKKLRKKRRKHKLKQAGRKASKLKMATKMLKTRGSRVQPGAGDDGSYAVVDPSSHAVASSANAFAAVVEDDPISSTNTKDFLGLLERRYDAGGSQGSTERTDGDKKIADHDKEKGDGNTIEVNLGEKKADIEKTLFVESDLLDLLDAAALTSSESESDGGGNSVVNAANASATLQNDVEEATGKSPRKKLRKKHRKHKIKKAGRKVSSLKRTTKNFETRESQVEPGATDDGNFIVVDPSFTTKTKEWETPKTDEETTGLTTRVAAHSWTHEVEVAPRVVEASSSTPTEGTEAAGTAKEITSSKDTKKGKAKKTNAKIKKGQGSKKLKSAKGKLKSQVIILKR
jgi:hypothetical protein